MSVKSRDVDAHMLVMANAIEQDDSKMLIESGMALLRGFLVDVDRIAHALEVLASKDVNK